MAEPKRPHNILGPTTPKLFDRERWNLVW